MQKQYFFSGLFILLFTAMSFAHNTLLEDADLAPRFFIITLFNVISIAGLLILLKKNSISITFVKNPLFLSLLVFIITLSLGYFKSINKADALFEILKMIAAYSFLINLLLLFSANKIDVKTVAMACLIATGVTIVYTAWNIFTEYQYSVSRQETFIISYSIIGNHCNKNPLAEFLLLALPLNTFLILSSNSIVKFSSLFVCIVSILLIALLKSAAVLLALTLTSLIIISVLLIKKYALEQKRIVGLVLSALLMLCLVSICNKTISNRISLLYHYIIEGKNEISSSNNNSTFERLLLLHNTWEMIKDEPLTGVGLANWKIMFPKYGYSGAKYLISDTIKFTRAHNDYLQFWSENGLLCFLSFIAVFLFALILTLKKLNATDKNNYKLMLVCISGLLSYFILCLFSYTSERPFNLIMLMIYIGVILSTGDHHKIVLNKTPVTIGLIILLCLNFYGNRVFADRIKDEALLHKVIAMQKKKSYVEMLKYATRIDEKKFPIDYTATPINWFKATAYYLNDKKETAKTFYIKALEQAPYHVQVLTDAGVQAEQSGNLLEAETLYKESLKINKYFPQARLNLAALKYNQKKISEAYDQLRGFMPKSISKTLHSKMVDFKKTFLLALADSALLQMQQKNLAAPPREKIFYQDLLAADSIAQNQNIPITESLILVFSGIK